MRALNLKNINKTYKNGFVAVKDVNFSVAQGDFLALLGPNGAGKSTIIGIICSLVNKTSGDIRIFDINPDTDPELSRQSIGVVPQEFNFNVFEPIVEILVNQAGYYGIPRTVAFERAEVLLKQLKLWDKRRDMARQLSGGMKRRLMIARALMHQPRLLILDEPTAGVDIEIRRSMWAFLRQLNQQGTTIILTTHYLEEAEQLCNHIAIIDEGSIIKDCAMKELLTQVSSDCLILDLVRPLPVLPELKPFQIHQQDDWTLEVAMDKQFTINELMAALSSLNIQVRAVRNKSNRLEQLFMELVA